MKLRKSIFSAAAVVALSSLALTGCGSSSGSSDAKGGTPLVTEGTLTVCSDVPYQPFEFNDASGKVIGFDVDIAQAIADANKLKLSVIDSSFEAISSGQFTTNCDIAASSISITDDRKKSMDFSEPYYDDDLVLIAAKNSGITSIESAKGKAVGVQQATTGEKYATEHGLTPTQYEDGGLQVQGLESGQVGAVLGNQSVLKYAIKDKPEYTVVQEIKTGEKLGIAVGKGNTELLKKVNTTLAELKSSGKLEELRKKWFEAK